MCWDCFHNKIIREDQDNQHIHIWEAETHTFLGYFCFTNDKSFKIKTVADKLCFDWLKLIHQKWGSRNEVPRVSSDKARSLMTSYDSQCSTTHYLPHWRFNQTQKLKTPVWVWVGFFFTHWSSWGGCLCFVRVIYTDIILWGHGYFPLSVACRRHLYNIV